MEQNLNSSNCRFLLCFSKFDFGGYWYGFSVKDKNINVKEKLINLLPPSYDGKKDDSEWIGLKKQTPLGWTTFIYPENETNEAYLRYARASTEKREAEIKVLTESILSDIKEFEDCVHSKFSNIE